MSNLSSTPATTDIALPADIAAALVDANAHADPARIHAAYSWARANNPLGIARVDGFDPFWVVTKHADIMQVSRDNTTFHSGDLSSTVFPKAAIAQFMAMNGRPQVADTLITMDQPEHRKLRNITQSWFMPGNLLELESRIRNIAKAVADKMHARGGECDFVADVALHYPLHVVMDILGVPAKDEPLMLKLTQEIFSTQDAELSRDQAAAMDPTEQANQIAAVLKEFSQYFATITADRLKNPRNDIATLLATAEVDGAPLSDAVRSSYYLIIATAGHDTTSSSTATAMWALAKFPDLLPRLKADPSLISGLVEESIRWGTPVRHFMRSATVDTELRGRTIRKGDWLMLCYPSANHDEEVFEQPFEFLIDRKPNRHISFGHGAHICLGQHLARLEMRRLFEELIPRLESVELAGVLELSSSNFVNGPKHLPIRYRMS